MSSSRAGASTRHSLLLAPLRKHAIVALATHKLLYSYCHRTLHTAFYKDVKNSAALHKALLDQEFDVALINASLVRNSAH